MTTGESLLVFYLATAVICLLPLLPIIRTWLGKPQIQPHPGHEHDPSESMKAFGHLVQEQFGALLDLARHSGPIRGANERGLPFIVLGVTTPLVSQIAPKTKRLRNLVLSAGHLEIPDSLVCEREIFAEGNIHIASRSLIRAALSHRNIIVGRRARILRWIYGSQRIEVQETALIKGWAEAGQEIRLARRSQFTHLQAPVILFGRQPVSPRPDREDTVARFDPPAYNPAQPCYGRHLDIPARHSVKGDLFVSHHLVIGDHCHIIGDLRSDGSIEIGHSVVIVGSIYAGGTITVGAECFVRGPVISKGELQLGFRCIIGHASEPTTTLASTLLLHEGCVAYGCVHALLHGEVLTDERSAR